MRQVSVNQFRASLKSYVEKAAKDHEPLIVTRRAGQNFVVIGAEDWERIQETLYVMSNSSLMSQIEGSLITNEQKKGYHPTEAELDEINSI